MTRGLRRGGLRTAVIAGLLILSAVLPGGGALPAAAEESLTFTGHGWGHGRGMGQYGALGYAVDHGWDYQRILAHYYGGTSLRSDAGNPAVAVELTRFTGAETVVQGNAPLVDGAAVGSGYAYLRAVRDPNGTYTVSTGGSCSGPWTTWRSGVASGLTIAPRTTSAADMLRTCDSGTRYGYRGFFRLVGAGGTPYTFNVVGVDDYLRGVVPRESPASWGSLGGGAGMNALRAQAVAARSYALSGSRPSGATTCDTTACQVYRGSFTTSGDGAAAVRTSLEHPNTEAAVTSTSGQVMRTAAGAVARTEFSSSTGGYTAGGVFPAVVDDGDATSRNPNHSWSVSVATSKVAAAFGVSGVRSIRVTARNGLGADGGRATQVTVTATDGTQSTLTGARVRTALGLKSDWFSVSGYTGAEAEAVVRALYQDLLGRQVDASGLGTWTNKLLTGTSQSELVTSLTSSEEYRRLRITQAYQQVLGRAPEAAGMTSWLNRIAAGQATVDDVRVQFYASEEYYLRSGRTDTGYVGMLYNTALGRSGSPAEVQQWVERIPTSGRSGVVRSIWYSEEAARRRAAEYYAVFLDRAPDPGGLATWSRVLLSSGEGAVRTGIAGSVEYRLLAVRTYG